MSPESGKRAANAHRSKHENMKQARRREDMEARKENRDRRFLREILSDVPRSSAQFNSTYSDITLGACIEFE